MGKNIYVEGISIDKNDLNTISNSDILSPITESFEEYIDRHKNDMPLDIKEVDKDDITKTINTNFKDKLSVSDIEELSALVLDWKAKNVSTNEAYIRLPQFLKNEFNILISDSSLDKSAIRNAKSLYVSSLLDGLITNTEMSNSVDYINDKINDLYEEFGYDLGLLYAGSVFEKIRWLENIEDKLNKYITSMNINNTNEINEEDMTKFLDIKAKLENINIIHNSMMESITFNDFAYALPHIRVRHIDIVKPEKRIRDFMSKYSGNKFKAPYIQNVITALSDYCEYTKEEAIIMTICLCQYFNRFDINKPEDHCLIFYTISNIISIAYFMHTKSKYAEMIIDNLKLLKTIRFNLKKSDKYEYNYHILTKEDVDKIIEDADKTIKEMKEKEDKFEKHNTKKE